MLVRIVKMTFDSQHINEFKDTFEAHKHLIRNFKGCTFLELYQDLKQPEVFFTYSYWETEEALNTYRVRSCLKKVWSTTKVWFSAKPEAWSVQKIVSLS